MGRLKKMSRPWVKLWTKTIDDEKIRFVIRRYGHDCWTVFTALLLKTKDGTLELDEEIFADSLFIEDQRYGEIKKILVKIGLIGIDDNGRPFLPKWQEYQGSEEEIAAYRLSNAQRQKRFREAKTDSNVTNNVTRNVTETDSNVTVTSRVTLRNATEEEVELDIEKEEEIHTLAVLNLDSKSEKSEKDAYGGVVSPMFSSIRKSFQSKTPLWSNQSKEVEAIRKLENLFGQDQDRARRYLNEFFNLTKSSDKFWSRQPFLPSRLVSLFGDVATRAEKEIENRTQLDEVFG